MAVHLYEQTSGLLSATKLTASDGTYTFDVNAGAGMYKIFAGLPTCSLDGKETAGNLGSVVDNTRDIREITGISVGAPGTTNDAVDYRFASFQPSRLQGMAWEDFNNDGDDNFGEKAIAGVSIVLTSIDDRGNLITLTSHTDSQGIYEFLNLRPGEYTLAETQPAGFASYPMPASSCSVKPIHGEQEER